MPPPKDGTKPPRRKTYRVKRTIVGWVIEETETPGQFRLSLSLVSDSDDGSASPTTRTYFVQSERLAELGNGLMKMMEEAGPPSSVDGKARVADHAAPARPDDRESDAFTSHLALGVYGLVGN
jgi:hypothetical protein